MAESNLDMIIRTIREGGNVTDEAIGDLKEFDKGLTNVEKTMAGTRTTIGKLDESLTVMGKNVGSATELMSGLGMNIPISPMQLFGEAIRLGGTFIKNSMDDYAAYVEEISRLAAFANTSTEEMSKLHEIAEDLRIPISSLEMAFKAMVQNGIAPTIEEMIALSEQYNAIQDPVQRAQFLLENFGRAGQDMARIMEMGGEAIQTEADKVKDFMLVTGMTEDQVKEYLATLDELDDTYKAIGFTIGNAVIPPWTKFLQFLLKPSTEAAAQFIDTMYAGTWAENLFVRPDARTGSSKAGGGGVFPGNVYEVGEREKEWFVPNVPGTIVPGGAGGGGVVINVYADSVVGTTDELTQKLTPVIYDALRMIQGAGGG